MKFYMYPTELKSATVHGFNNITMKRDRWAKVKVGTRFMHRKYGVVTVKKLYASGTDKWMYLENIRGEQIKQYTYFNDSFDGLIFVIK